MFFLWCGQAFSLWKNAATLPSTSHLCEQSKVKPGRAALKQPRFQKAGGGLLGGSEGSGGLRAVPCHLPADTVEGRRGLRARGWLEESELQSRDILWLFDFLRDA